MNKLIALITVLAVILSPVLLQRYLRLALLAARGAGVNKEAFKMLRLDVVLDVVLALVGEAMADGAGVAALLPPSKHHQIVVGGDA